MSEEKKTRSLYTRYNQLSIRGRILVVMIALLVGWLLLPVIISLVRALVMLAIVAAIIVGALWLFEQVRR